MEAEDWSCHADKPPLYLQHEGHSRTIIGIEKMFRAAGEPPSVALLILDPSTRTGPLDRALRGRKGWQVLILWPIPCDGALSDRYCPKLLVLCQTVRRASLVLTTIYLCAAHPDPSYA